MVPHERLLVKLGHYGIRNNTQSWIRSFLSERSQRVVVDGEISQPAPVISGVPQGSVLGPILFLIFINDMPECVNAKCRLFADDTIIYQNITNTDDSQNLQNDLNALSTWADQWGMAFNPIKCNTIHISRKRKPSQFTYNLKGQPLETVDAASYLGVQISKDVAWNHHISKMVAKANCSLASIEGTLKPVRGRQKT